MRGRRPVPATARRRWWSLAAAAAATVLVAVPVGPAGAQSGGSTTVTTAPGPSTPDTTVPPAAPGTPRLRLLSQTAWVKPGGALRLVVTASDVPDPAAIDVGVSMFPRVTNRADLSASFAGDTLRNALWQLPGGPVHLADLPSAADGSRTITIPTQAPDQPLDRSKARVQSGIYPVEVELLSTATGDVVDRLVTHLLAPEVPKEGRMGVVTVLPLSARPAVAPDGTRSGPPDGTATIAAVAGGLAAAPTVPVAVAPSPETLEALNRAAPDTAKALAAALADRPLIARPYVPLRIPSLGDAAGSVLSAQLEAGASATAAVLGRGPTSVAWVADEPLDTAGAGELAGIGVTQLIVSGADLAPPAAVRTDRPNQPVAIPRQPVPVSAGGGRSLQALVADPALATHTDPATPAADQPLAAHQLLTELAGIALLPQSRGGTPPPIALGGAVATILPPRSWRPTQAFLTELLTGLSESPVLVGVDPGAAFSLPSPAAPLQVTATTGGIRRSTTTTLPVDERTLIRLPPPDTRLGRAAAGTRATLAAHTSVLPDLAQPEVPLTEQVLVAESADLDPDEQLRRLDVLDRSLEGDLAKIRIPGGRDLRLTSRAGELPIGIVNDAPSQAHVLLRVSSEKLEFPGGTDHTITLDRANTTEQVRVRAKTAGAFPLRVTLLSPDGTRVLDVAEYRVRSNSLPGVGIAISVAAGLVLAFWWGKTLLFQPRGAHSRRR